MYIMSGKKKEKDGGEGMSVKKRILEVTIFLLVMFLTFYTLFSGKNLGEIANAVSKMSVGYLVPAAALAIFFVCAEGYMIWYLLQAMKANRRKEGSSLIRCIQYSFIGFFYSGITPSATGGQPVQLYYMSKDGNRGSDSTVVLMTVAVVYKFVLVILGAAILLFWYRPLYSELGKFFPLYLFGLLLNVILVVVIAGIMLMPNIMLRCALFFEKLFVKMSILKPSEKRPEKIHEFIGSYQNAVSWLRTHKGKLLLLCLLHFYKDVAYFFDIYGIPWIRAARNRNDESYPSSSRSLYSGRYASASGSAGNYRADVSNCVCPCIYRYISYTVHACKQRN